MKSIRTLSLIDYEITYDRMETEFHRQLPQEALDRIADIATSIHVNPQEAIGVLERLKDRYGPLPVLYNYLSSAYMVAGQQDRAEKYINANYANNPEYLFAKLNYADLCLMQGEFKEVPRIFNYEFELGMLYPNRRKFHITEVVGFYSTMALYFRSIMDYPSARMYYRTLKQLAPRHPKTRQVKRALYPSIIGFVFRTVIGLFRKDTRNK